MKRRALPFLSHPMLIISNFYSMIQGFDDFANRSPFWDIRYLGHGQNVSKLKCFINCRLPCLVINLQTHPCNYFIWLQATFACFFIFGLYFLIPFSVIVICVFM